jgi:hypothetical protein
MVGIRWASSNVNFVNRVFFVLGPSLWNRLDLEENKKQEIKLGHYPTNN